MDRDGIELNYLRKKLSMLEEELRLKEKDSKRVFNKIQELIMEIVGR